jgi:hypothetical protein
MYQIPVKSGKFSDILVTIIEVILGILKPESLHHGFHGDEFA